MKKFEFLEELDYLTNEVDEFTSLSAEILENKNDPEGCANYINGRFRVAKSTTDLSTKEDILKNVFGYICGLESVSYEGGNFQLITISKINDLDQTMYNYLRSLNVDSFGSRIVNQKSFDKAINLLGDRLKQLDPSFK